MKVSKLLNNFEYLLTIIFSIAIFHSLSWFISTSDFASWDLYAHIELINKLKNQLSAGRVFFFDPYWFSGWPAFTFYGPLAHILTAVSSLILGLPIALLVKFYSLLSISLLPCSLVFFAKSFYYSKDQKLFRRILLTLFCIVFSFWFLLHEKDSFGFGLNAVTYIGLYPQTFAWHLLLIHIGFLLRFLQSEKDFKLYFLLSFSFIILIATHPMTALFALSVGLLSGISIAKERLRLLSIYLMSLLSVSFWLLPVFVYSESFTPSDPFPKTAGVFELLFAYPLSYFSELILQTLNLELSFNELLFITIFIAMVSIVLSRSFWSTSHLSKSFLLLIFFISFIFSSSYVTKSLSLSVHYYRFTAYAILLMIGTLSAILTNLATLYSKYLSSILLIVLVCLSFMGLRQISNTKYANNILQDEYNVLVYLKEQSLERGRVLFEHQGFDNRLNTPHFLSSRLREIANLETANGIFIQSSLTQRFYSENAALLGLESYQAPAVMLKNSKRSMQVILEQLIESKVSWIVVHSDKAKKNLKKLFKPMTEIGKYSIFQITNPDSSRVSSISKPLIAYYDLANTLPFKYLEYFIYSQENLWKQLDILELKPGQKIPSEAAVILINGVAEKFDVKKILNNIYEGSDNRDYPPILLNFHYMPDSDAILKIKKSWNKELHAFNYAGRFLQQELKLVEQLDNVLSGLSNSSNDYPDVSFEFQNKFQDIVLNQLKPGQMVKLEYAYLPFWASADAYLYRGLGEKLYVLPMKESIKIKYRLRHSIIFNLGLALSLLNLIITFSYYRKHVK